MNDPQFSTPGKATPLSVAVRLLALAAVLALALMGRSRLSVDVENLAMKSEASTTAQALRAAEFNTDPHVLFFLTGAAEPSAQLEPWIAQLRARPEVTDVQCAPGPKPGQVCLNIGVKRTADGRYAAPIQTLSDHARATHPSDVTLSIAGIAPVEIAISRAMNQEQRRILPLIAGALALILFALYRNLLFPLVALLAPLIGVLVVEGLQGALGFSVDPISALLGPTLLTIGVAASVHVLERYRDQLALSGSPLSASRATARAMRLPLALTVATTVAGFMGLSTSPIPAVRRFGWLAAIGITVAVAVTWLYAPWMLASFHRRPLRTRVWRHMGPLAQRLQRARWVIVGLTAGLACTAVVLMHDNQVDSNPLHTLKANDPTRLEAEWIAAELGGSDVFELILPPRAGALPALTTLQALALAQQLCARPALIQLTEAPKVSANGYVLLTLLLGPGGSADREALFNDLEAECAAAGWSGAQATGLAVDIARDSNRLVAAQFTGIGITVLALWIVMALGFRSLRLGLLGLIPNVLPLLLIQGWRGAHGTPMSVASSMIGVVMLGLVVDDTIHWLHAYREAKGPLLERVTVALNTVTRPILFTTLVLSVGFAMTVFGELWATREFGHLAIATLWIALVADLLLLPALVFVLFKADDGPTALQPATSL